MSMWSPVLFEAAEHVERELPMPTYAYAIVAAAFFTILLMITMSYRHVGASRAAAREHS